LKSRSLISCLPYRRTAFFGDTEAEQMIYEAAKQLVALERSQAHTVKGE
jgi:hypothetical protein